MPELPEVETVKRGLQRLLPGKRIKNVVYDTDKSFPNAPNDTEQFLIGAEVVNVKRRAKVLMIELSSRYSLVVHLKMTGQLVFVKNSGDIEERWGAGHPNDSLIGHLPDRFTRVTLTFTDDSRLFFNDQRKFGWMRLLPSVEIPNIDFFKKVGPEPLDSDFTAKEFIVRVRRRAKTTIKAALLDQTVVAGIGNIYADEALFAARIHPATRVQDINDKKLAELLIAIKDILQLSIDKGGSSDKNYVDAEGKRGSYLGFAQVFRREGQPCPLCGGVIEKIRVAGRGTHICPACQKLPKEVKR